MKTGSGGAGLTGVKTSCESRKQTYAFLNAMKFTLAGFGWSFLAFAFLVMWLTTSAAQTITNAGFETPTLTANSYLYYSSMSAAQQNAFGWVGNGGALIQYNSSVWGFLPAPDGNQTLALFGVGAVSQTVNFPSSGLYQLTWQQASRAGDVNPTWVQLDGTNVHQFSTANPAWTTNSCTLTVISAGNHTLGFAGTAPFLTVGLDGVSLAFIPYNQWQRAELSFTGTGNYTNPVTQVNLMVRFTGPSNQVYNVPGFWAGSNNWRVRFAPTVAGIWTCSNSCNVVDPGLAPRSRSITVNPPTGTNALYLHGGFLHSSADKHYLTYADGTPFFWLGDTSWFCPGNLAPIDGSTSTQYVTASMFEQLVNQRQRQNFDIMHLAFIGTLGPGNNSPQTQMSSGTIDPAYWQQVDRYMDYANDSGVVPVVSLDTWYYDLPNFTTNQFLFLWRYFLARYGAHAVTFLICGEYNSDSNLTNLTNDLVKVNAIGTLIKQIDPYQRAFTVHPAGYTLDGRQQWGWPWYGFIMFQGGHPGHGNVPPTSLYTQGWNVDKPVIEGEANYEGLYSGGAKVLLPSDVRTTAYQAIQAGAAGYTYGAAGLWYPTQSTNDQTFWSIFGTSLPWWQALYFPGATDMTYLRGFYESIPWWKLQPRPGAVSIQGGPLPDASQPLAKSDGDNQYVVWFPLGNGATVPATLALNVTNGAGSYTAAWFNPQTGQRTTIGSPVTATNGVCPLPARPDANDWLLLLNMINALTPPLAPAGLAAVAGFRQATLSWNASAGATNYNVERGVTSGGPYTLVGNTSSTGYTDTNLINGASYFYVVSAVNAWGEGANSTEVSVVPAMFLVVGNPSFEITVTNSYSISGWNNLPQPGSWLGGGSAFDTLNPAVGSHFSNVQNGTNCCYLASAGPISQDLRVTINAAETVTLNFYEGRANDYLGANISSLSANIAVGNQSITSNFDDSTVTPGAWVARSLSWTAPTSGNLKISFANVANNSFLDEVSASLAPPPPQLGIGVSSGNLLLSWGLDAESFNIYSSTNLVLWTKETPVLTTNNEGISAILPLRCLTEFFRLQK